VTGDDRRRLLGRNETHAPRFRGDAIERFERRTLDAQVTVPLLEHQLLAP
jgi:hypothetical protein